MKRRLGSLVLALVMVAVMLPVTARAAVNGTCGGNAAWTLDDDGTLTVSGTGAIDDYDCEWGADCPPWNEYRDRISSVVVQEGITRIGKEAFGSEWGLGVLDNLASVRLPSTLRTIGKNAFANAGSLSAIELPNGLVSVEAGAFDGAALKEIYIPASLQTIEKFGLGRGEKMEQITVASGNAVFAAINNVLYKKNSASSWEILLYPDGNTAKTYTIPSQVSVLSGNILAGKPYLQQVVVPSSVKEIQWSVFEGCPNLSSVVLSEGVTSIDPSAFWYCGKLLTLEVPASVTHFNSEVTTGIDGGGEDGSQMSVYFKGNTPPVFDAVISAAKDPDSGGKVTIYYPADSSGWDAVQTQESVKNAVREGVMEFKTWTPTSGSTVKVDEYIYDVEDPGVSVVLPTEELEKVTNTNTAVSAVRMLTNQMTSAQKSSATGVDLATLYAETATAKAARKAVNSNEVIINAAAVADLEKVAKETSSAVESALVSGGVSTARYLANTVTLSTNATGEISIKIDPDILTTEVDKIRVETPTYALTLKVDELEADLTDIMTITMEDTGVGYAAGRANSKTVVSVNLPNGKTSNPVTLSLPTDKSNTTYQAVVTTTGKSTSSKYNPATVTMDGKITASGSYTIQTNEKNFSDISNKSAEMQAAIRYLASKGIINGKTSTTFDPDGSINRAEIAALLVRALGKLDNGATSNFTDVKSSDWYYAAAGSSQHCGLIKGYNDRTFRGLNTISKVEIVAVASRVLTTEMGYTATSNTENYLSKYSDTVVNWAQKEVALATRENLIVYRTDGTFSGTKNMTRGDAAIIIYRLFQRIW